MPLHLLGKKSWNVYNEENVARVRRDEAAAKAEEEAEEQRMQEEDSARRIAILRGEQPAPLSESASVTDPHERRGPDQGVKRSRDAGPVVSHERKRRRLRGEDDTDRDIQYAREDAESNEKVRNALAKTREGDASLVDESGHLQLFAPPKEERHHVEKNPEGQDEQERKRRREEDRYTMRSSNAGGFKQGTEEPWYASQKSQSTLDNSRSTALQLPELAGKDVWGNEDPLRKERERNRISSSDPFAAMQQAQRQLKQSEHDRACWQSDRAKEIDDLKQDEERKRRHGRRYHRRKHGDEHDGLESFSLDSTEGAGRGKDNERKRSHHHHRRRHSRSRSRERRRHRHPRSREN
ncbi:hypothetical protein KC363_g3449 [Hortaea werneckii]|uniref:CBF1-interacting co-repressor CIR N-terminal domain-containing protein n=1 Tax=Hortaea werneckii TaxID=91943 RepID=A0A3M7FQS2_HORWE|nr:hypothetical protein KC363_g3449 [Hortaea werneckii]RMY91185.1 hypothetical protein D0861_03202 [Hortaea werneckii]